MRENSKCNVKESLKRFVIDGEEYKPIKDYGTFYLCVSEFGINLKRIPKLTVVK